MNQFFSYAWCGLSGVSRGRALAGRATTAATATALVYVPPQSQLLAMATGMAMTTATVAYPANAQRRQPRVPIRV